MVIVERNQETLRGHYPSIMRGVPLVTVLSSHHSTGSPLIFFFKSQSFYNKKACFEKKMSGVSKPEKIRFFFVLKIYRIKMEELI